MMRRSILLAVLALGAPAATAQETADPMDDGAVLEETATTDAGTETGTSAIPVATGEADAGEEVAEEPGEGEVPVDGTGEGIEVVVDVSGEVPVGETDEGSEVVGEPEVPAGETDDETEVVEESEIGPGEVVGTPEDNRSARGTSRGGHHGSVSTLARAGLGRVFGSLRSQGYGDIEIGQVGDEIMISAARSGEVRHLVYDATSGALISDTVAPSSPGILRTIASKLKQGRKESEEMTRETSSKEAKGGGSDKASRGNGSGKGGSQGKGGKGGGSKAGNGTRNGSDRKR